MNLPRHPVALKRPVEGWMFQDWICTGAFSAVESALFPEASVRNTEAFACDRRFFLLLLKFPYLVILTNIFQRNKRKKPSVLLKKNMLLCTAGVRCYSSASSFLPLCLDQVAVNGVCNVLPFRNLREIQNTRNGLPAQKNKRVAAIGGFRGEGEFPRHSDVQKPA